MIISPSNESVNDGFQRAYIFLYGKHHVYLLKFNKLCTILQLV